MKNMNEEVKKTKKPRSNKYNVGKKTERIYDGIVFDSKMEMDYYIEKILPSLESGEIKSFERQKRFLLQPDFKRDGKSIRKIEYVADFYITYADGHVLVVDVKGYPDSVATLKRKMFWYQYPELDYIWLTKVVRYGGWLPKEEVDKIRRANKRAKEKAALEKAKQEAEEQKE